ncbi:MAG TPA: hypothetical protein VE978_01890 [Chitinophagales bacterium]|nr:hypothetical protein [Chitinophagales bacterium]
MKSAVRNSTRISVRNYLSQFRKFSRKQQLDIAKRINKETFEEQWKKLDQQLPDIDISEEEIMSEVRAVRYGSKAGKNLSRRWHR